MPAPNSMVKAVSPQASSRGASCVMGARLPEDASGREASARDETRDRHSGAAERNPEPTRDARLRTASRPVVDPGFRCAAPG
ncbi:hypothetical protein JCM2811A_03600 [Methylorubrum rhodinum]